MPRCLALSAQQASPCPAPAPVAVRLFALFARRGRSHPAATCRLRLLEGLRAIPGIECARAQGAFYLFPNIEKLGLSDSEFAARILEEEKVAVVPGSAFGADGYVRLSYATSDDVINKGLERLARFCAKLG